MLLGVRVARWAEESFRMFGKRKNDNGATLATGRSETGAMRKGIKDLIKRTTQCMAQGIAEEVLKMKTAGAICSYLTSEIRRIWPDAVLLDTSE